ncbi:MAG: hypothetical protein R3B48_13295 [Kofleriaceae bacterium]
MIRWFLLVLALGGACSAKKTQRDDPAAAGSSLRDAAVAVVDARPEDAPVSSAGEGGAAGDDASAGAGDAGDGSAGGADAFEFDKLTRRQKLAFMKQKVMPVMKEAFQSFDPVAFAEFTCKTCHGESGKANKHKMPTAELPKLDFKKLKAGKQKPRIAEFMSDVINPKMAALLHQPEQSEAQPNGFGCLDCHVEKP